MAKKNKSFILVCEALLKIVLEKQLVCARKFMSDFASMNTLKSAAGSVEVFDNGVNEQET